MKIAHDLYIQFSRRQKGRAKRYQALFKVQVSDKELGGVRTATQSDMVLGNDIFKEGIEMLIGRRVTPRKRGRKPSQKA